MSEDNVIEFPSPPEWKKSYQQYVEEEQERQLQIENTLSQMREDITKKNALLQYLYNTYEAVRPDIEKALKK